MKKLKSIVAVLLAITVVAAIFTACSSSPEKKLIGKWTDSTGDVTIEFQEGNVLTVQALDGKSSLLNLITDNIKGSYTTTKKDDGNYYITITVSSIAAISGEYMFVIEGETLTLKDPSTGDNKWVFFAKTEAETTTPTVTQ